MTRRNLNCNEIIKVLKNGIDQALNECGVTGPIRIMYHDYALELCGKCVDGCNNDVVEEVDKKYVERLGADKKCLGRIKRMALLASGMTYNLF